jgi:inosine-uridine nucleoside N-ribohydrolase
MPRRFVIDTDTASDDAVALVLALTEPSISVEAITVVAGNVPLDRAVQNALYTRELCGSKVPVHAGAGEPVHDQGPVTAENVHGQDGMGDVGLPLTGREPDEGSAVDALVDLAHRYPGEITLVTLGPLTNVALALRKDPSIARLYQRVVVMGGTGDHSGNMTPAAEFNIYFDPEAAAEVFASGMPLEMVGWDVSRDHAVLSPAEMEALRATGRLGAFCMDIQAQLLRFCREVTRIQGIDLPDPVTVAYAIDPTIATRTRRAFVAVETTGTHTRGMTVVDALGLTGNEPNALVVDAAHHERFVAMLHTAGAR